MELPTFPIFERETKPDAPLGVPEDLAHAHRMFQANCGPASFAALVGTLITDIIRFFPHFPDIPHTSIPQMRRALRECGVEYQTAQEWPRLGLGLIQFTGPWTARGSYHESAQNRHWVAVRHGKIYDINAHAWLPLWQWKTEIMQLLVESRPTTTGWLLAKSYEVLPTLQYLPEFPLAEQSEPSRDLCALCN
jgi:hypothetical protein